MEYSHTLLNDELMRKAVLKPKPVLDLILFGVTIDD